jgi:hypothetical protein
MGKLQLKLLDELGPAPGPTHEISTINSQGVVSEGRGDETVDLTPPLPGASPTGNVAMLPRYASGEGRGGEDLTVVIGVLPPGMPPEPHSRSAGM